MPDIAARRRNYATNLALEAESARSIDATELDSGGKTGQSGGDWRKRAIGVGRAAPAPENSGDAAPLSSAEEDHRMAENFHQLYDDAKRVTGTWGYRELALLTGTSVRTLQRYHGQIGGFQLDKLILATFEKNADLARRLALSAGRSLEALGIAPPPPPPPAPPPVKPAEAPAPPVAAPLSPERLRQNADSVLLAAADAANLPPEAVRPAVAAALARARDLDAKPADLAAHLAKPLRGTPKG